MQGLVKCPIYPTEDRERIREAVSNVIVSKEVSFEIYGNLIELRISFEGKNNLEWLRNRIHELRIIDAARARLQFNKNGLQTKMSFDKQAAYNGKIKLLDDREETPSLGCIELQLKFANENEFEDFLRYFTPPTRKGHVVN